MHQVIIGRQPILDVNGELYGYELLCRDRDGKVAVVGNGDRESTVMLLDSILSIGLERLTRSHRAFINVTETLLLGTLIDSLPPANVVLEVLETVKPSAELLHRLAVLRSRRFTIALDDFVLDDHNAMLVDQADIIKLDVRLLDDAAVETHAQRLRGRGLRLLAEKVETRAEFERLRALGFDLFQGYYFARPELYSARTLRPNRLSVLQLLARINDPDITIVELANLIRADVALSVALLRWTNSAGSILGNAVESIDRAIITLGLHTIQNWLGLIVLARLGSRHSELVTTVLVRARTLELFAQAEKKANPAGYFTVGLLSALDVMMETPMSAALEHLPLAPELKDALEHQRGDQGAALKAVIAMEIGDFDGIRYGALSRDVLCDCYVDAAEWADQFVGLAARP